MDKWPCSFIDEAGRCHPLDLHNLRVAYTLKHLFEQRLSALTPTARSLEAFTGLEKPLLQSAVLAAVFHDAGKSSSLYRVWAERGKASFAMHEHVSALTLLKGFEEISRESGSGCTTVARIAASALARHHTAMKGRHPDDVARGGSKAVKTIVEASSKLSPDLAPSSVPVNTLEKLAREGFTRAAEAGSKGVETVKSHLYYTTTEGIRKQARAIGINTVNEAMLLAAVQTVAGALIVSDILVAWRERGEEDRPAKAYATSWMRELEAREALEKAVREDPESMEQSIEASLQDLVGKCISL
ncbi:tRNA nucleotidyltransferase [Aeropyrum pernix]|uniref:tRNA nucleotidyltransferase n=1 Tax=Aeropyrum pernix TaxID=56636 RepID=A0A401H8Q3_AERPX|nr:HD domain-containing protein [Aeropyrum pernix]GBF08719.1 tRNA nucleotidyltransferase [Aeropyrum pernix]